VIRRKAVPNYAIDSENQPMTATGIVEPVREWDETPEGKRRPSDRQARNELTGMPLWAVEVLYIQTAFGRESTATAKVTVDSVEEPRPAPLTEIRFNGLRVEVRINKAGGFTEFWSAEGLRDVTKAPTKSPDKAVA
jgi:hypothetical protein